MPGAALGSPVLFNTHTQHYNKLQTPHYLGMGETEALNLSKATIHGGKSWC